MKKPNPSDTTSTGMPAACARRDERHEARVVGLGGGRREQRRRVRVDQRHLPGHQPPRAHPAGVVGAAASSQTPGTCSAMTVSVTSVSEIVPS